MADNDGDIGTIDTDVFTGSHLDIPPVRFVNTTPVWVDRTAADGVVPTKEGQPHHSVGDYLVFNKENRTDGCCVSAAKFEAMYEPDPGDPS